MRRYWKVGAWLGAAIIVAWITYAAFGNVNWVYVNKGFTSNFRVEELGVTGYVFHNAWKDMKQWQFDRHLGDIDVASYKKFLASRARARQVALAATPMIKKRYIIMIQMESIAASALTLKVNGHYAAPFMRHLRTQSIWFKNTFDETGAGRSSDAQILALTGIVPLRGEPVVTNQDETKVPALPHVFAKAGYKTISVYGYKGGFWNIRNSHAALGFEKQYFEKDLDASQQLGWGISDRSIIAQAVNILAQQKGKVFMHITTLSSHGPFDFVRDKFGGPDKGIINDYIRSVHYVDGAIHLLFKKLKAKGLLKQSLVAIYGDHDSGITVKLIRYQHSPNHHGAAHDKITMMVYGLGHDVVTRPSGLQDLGPTILASQGLKIPATMVGGLPGSKTSVLLLNGRQIMRLDKQGNPVEKSIPVNIRTLTMLSLYFPNKLMDSEREHQ